MVMLHLLRELAGAWRWQIHVAHFNHRLRGRASAGDERFVRSEAARLGLKFHSERWDDRSKKDAIRSHGVEQAGRDARRAFFGRVASEINSKHLVLAHHADDQVELFFIRLVRGAGSHGLGGMKRSRKVNLPPAIRMVRPLLDFSRDELEQWAREHDIRHRMDASNIDERYVRNRVRHRLIPEIDSLFSTGARSKVLQTMKILSDESDWIREMAARLVAKPRAGFAELPVPIQRQVIVLQLERAHATFDFETVEFLRRNEGTRINTPGDRFFARDSFGRVIKTAPARDTFSQAFEKASLAPRRGEVRLGDLTIRWRKSRRSESSLKQRSAHREVFDLSKLKGEIMLRHWRPGDRFQPIGSSKPSKLQDLFTNAKIPAGEKRRRVVAESGAGTIFWVEGLRIGDVAKVRPETRELLVWSWER